MSNNCLLTIQKICKSYSGIRVLQDVNLTINQGEIVGLVGENGAGKSTLMKILSGAISADSGSFTFSDQNISSWTPMKARDAGIITIYQELSLVPELSVAENIYLGVWPTGSISKVVDRKAMNERAREILKKLDLNVDPDTPVKKLSIAARQMVEIGRALQIKPKLLILDEPTSSLSQDDAAHLHEMMKQLLLDNTSIIYISHRLEDVMEVCDRIVVLKDGKISAELGRTNYSRETIVGHMIGRQVYSYGIGGHARNKTVLEVKNLSVGKKVKDVSFYLQSGEILGIAGLMGSGRSTIAKSIFGLNKRADGQIILNGTEVKMKSPAEAIRHRIGFLPEDRRLLGLFMQLSIRENISIANLKQFSRFGVVNQKSENLLVDGQFNTVNIKAPSARSVVSTLSGGNQQKVVLARWLAANCDILIFDEPTRGIDIGSKEEIYQLINEFVKGGGSVIVVSSEMPELMALSDRIVVIAEGHRTAEFSRAEATERKLMTKMIEYHSMMEEEV